MRTRAIEKCAAVAQISMMIGFVVEEVALSDLSLERLWVVHPGEGVYPLDTKIEAVGIGALSKVLSEAWQLRR
jgi:hypothetical protein